MMAIDSTPRLCSSRRDPREAGEPYPLSTASECAKFIPRIFCVPESGTTAKIARKKPIVRRIRSTIAIKGSIRSFKKVRMRRHLLFFAIALFACAKSQASRPAPSGSVPGEPDYAVWDRLLAKYYEPAHGMDYAHLKANDSAALQQLRQSLGRAAVSSLTPKQQLAYWINLYNVNVVTTVVEHYPVPSIRDISTDPIIRLNVFKKERVPLGDTKISLDDVENARIRAAFHDPRIHFAIHCAAKSCPPIRMEPYSGDRIDAQLDDQ